MNKAERINSIDYYIKRHSESSTSRRTWTAGLLHASIRDNKIMAVRLLIDLGADVTGKITRTPLHAAAFRKNLCFAELLLENEAYVEVVNYQSLTALQRAVMNGFEKTVELLLSQVEANVWRCVYCRVKIPGLNGGPGADSK